MKYLLLILTMMFGAVHADTSSNSTANAGAIAGSQSSSGANSNQGQSQGQGQSSQQGQGQSSQQGQGQSLTYAPTTIYKGGGHSTSDINYTTDENVDYSGSYTVRSAPGLIMPGMVSANPCLIPISAGISVIGGAFTAGTAMIDENCVAQNNAMRLGQLGMVDVGMEVMCGLEDVYTAAKRAGKPCIKNPEFEVAKKEEADRLGKGESGWSGVVGAK